MKRVLLIILSVMAFASMSVAQDIWSAGYYTDEDGIQQAAVYQNSIRVFSTDYGNGLYGDCTGIAVDGDDVYWIRNCYEAGSFYYADIMKNDEMYLNSPIGQSRHIYSLDCFYGTMIATGCMDINGITTAVVWSGDEVEPAFVMGDGVYPSVAYSTTVVANTDVGLHSFSCGYQFITESARRGIIWKDGYLFYRFPNIKAIMYDIDYHDGYFYTVGIEITDSDVKLKVWEVTSWGTTDHVLYTLSESMSSNYVDERFSIYVDDAGDIYVNGMDGTTDKVWKNGIEIYSTGSYFNTVLANTDGIYYAGSDGTGKVWKDGSVLYEVEDAQRITSFFVPEPACDNQVRTLPYFEGFETGATDWACWETEDTDNNNGTFGAFWHRFGDQYQPYTGNYCAWHDMGPEGVYQEGWLVTPLIAIPEGDNVRMSFKTKEVISNSFEDGNATLWVYDGTTTTELWSQSVENASGEWKEVEVDLSAFQGQEIQLGFKYTGIMSLIWYLDDIRIELGCVHVDENEDSQVKLYPNPAKDVIHVEGLETNTEVKIYDALGALVKVVNVGSDEEIDISELSGGLYLLHCGNATLRFVKTS